MPRNPRQETSWTEVAAPARIAAMVRPIIAKHIEWLDCHAGRPLREGKTDEEFTPAYEAYRLRLTAIRREFAAAYTVHRWDLREWALEHPAMRAGNRNAGIFFVVDGMRVELSERAGGWHVTLSGDGWRKLQAERAAQAYDEAKSKN